MAKHWMIAPLMARAAIFGFSIFATFAKASEFSADIVATTANGQPAGQPGKVYVSNDMARIEAPDVAGGFFVIDAAREAAFFVRPARKIFMDAKQSSPLTQILVPVNPDDPCRRWQALAVNAGAAELGGEWRCKRLGEETIAGRKAIIYSAVSPLRNETTVWIDAQLNFVIKSKREGGVTIELKNIQEGAQPPSLFEIPTDYIKFDPRRLIEIIKQSDVWVEPVK